MVILGQPSALPRDTQSNPCIHNNLLTDEEPKNNRFTYFFHFIYSCLYFNDHILVWQIPKTSEDSDNKISNKQDLDGSIIKRNTDNTEETRSKSSGKENGKTTSRRGSLARQQEVVSSNSLINANRIRMTASIKDLSVEQNKNL